MFRCLFQTSKIEIYGYICYIHTKIISYFEYSAILHIFIQILFYRVCKELLHALFFCLDLYPRIEKMQFSVIIPVFNRPDEVDELLESLTKQTYRQFEVIVVEDGSTQNAMKW